jgi:hypothetical protein
MNKYPRTGPETILGHIYRLVMRKMSEKLESAEAADAGGICVL